MNIDLTFCQKIPKVELHAHLNGSVSQKTLHKLYSNHPNKSQLTFNEKDLILSNKSNYQEAFRIFQILHSLVVDINCLQIITEDVITEFYADNVFYLELRSTPKSLKNSSKRDYVDAVVSTLKRCMKILDNLTVTFLISIDRGRSIEDALENLDLAIEYAKLYPDVVVGVDFSGDPSKGNIDDFIPILNSVKANGLMLTTHVGEVQDHEENLKMLHVKPDRVGHAVFIHPSHGGSELLHNQLTNEYQKLPIEICMTSNIIGGIVRGLSEHPIKEWYRSGHPFAVCTDDKGLFGCNLSDEYLKVAQVLKLTKREVWKLTEDSIQYISASNGIKKKLRKIWDQHKLELLAE